MARDPMLDMIAAVKAQAEREAEADYLITRRLLGKGGSVGAMLGELLGGDEDPPDVGPSPTLVRKVGR